MSQEAHKNQIVSDLRERLEAHYSRKDFDDHSLCMTMVSTGPWPRGTGIRPELLSESPDGERVYAINCGQARKFLERLGGTPPPKGDLR